MLENILVAIDGSPASTNALEMAVELSKKFGARLHLLHVVRAMQVPLTPGLMDEYEKLERQRHDLLKGAGERVLNQAKRSAESKDVDVVETDIGSGDPATAIIDYTKKKAIDLIGLVSRKGWHRRRRAAKSSPAHGP